METKARAYFYEFNEINMINLVIPISEKDNTDSLVAKLFIDATEADVESCGITFTSDICQAYDISGFNNPCNEEFKESLRNLSLEKVEDTYNKEKDTYTWALPIHIGKANFGSKIRVDIGITEGLKSGDKCDLLFKASTVDISSSWSLTAHKAEDGKPAYEGTPTWDKDQGDIQMAPEDPYIAIYKDDKRIWGFGPNDTVEVKKDTAATDTTKSDDKKDGIIASIPSMHIGSLHVAGRTLIAQAPAQGTKTLKVFDLLGNEVMSEAFSGESATVNLSNVSKRGTLVARLVMEGKVLNTKAIRIK